MKITLGVIFAILSAVYSQDPSCCHGVSDYTGCQQACDNMALESTSLRRRQHLPSLLNNCPLSLNFFWQCVNNSAPDIWEEDTGWMGRTCCHNALSRHCQALCTAAHSFAEVQERCSPRDEVDLFECLTRFQHKEQCCGQAQWGTHCRKKCEKLFDYHLPTKHMLVDANVRCTPDYPEVVDCLTNYTSNVFANVDPKDSLHCCDMAASSSCAAICHWVHINSTSEEEIMSALVDGCGNPNLADNMWKCFLLERSPETVPEDGNNFLSIDSARLQCCSRAVSDKCRDICIKLYSTSWSSKDSWYEFDDYCQYQPAEVSLLICLADVQEPCQPGCSGLDYCSNFNDRPTELYRSCNTRSDDSARNDMARWGNGHIEMPFMDIPVLDIAECESDRWKAVACTLQVKPCHSKSHTNMICKSDCVHILNQCIDLSRLPKGVTAEGLCNILSPMEKNAPCVPLDEYLVVDTAKFPKDQVRGLTYPCVAHSCANHSQSHSVCSIDREACSMGEVCKQHRCDDGCKLGDSSNFLVPVGSWIRLTDRDDEGCYQACQCGRRGEFEYCQALGCDQQSSESCRVSGQIREHGSHYHIDCNICTCYKGVEICSSRQCLTSEMLPEEQHRYTGLPCDCSDQYVPICAVNGKTYPSACLANCAEKLSDLKFKYGDCSMGDPCSSPDACPSGTWCLPKRAVCLSVPLEKCQQYECVSTPVNCENELYVPVCDTDGIQHPNLCKLQKRRKVLAYRGECMGECHGDGVQVCGHNGETYPSKCVAWQHKTTVDYLGPCEAVGPISDVDTVSQCDTIDCPELLSTNCMGITPPGSCCPVCAGLIRILFSKKEADTVALAMGSKALHLEDVLELLRRQIVVSECDLYGFLSIEGDIVVLVTPVPENPSVVEIEVCNREAVKLEALINTRSPLLVSYLQLTPLLAASTRKVAVTENSAALALCRPTYLQLILLFVCICLQKLLKDR
ncbi:reversion-inducing cysteine-rich protein with Kazal motifs-like isoform X2 [Apostichopus japonicus]|uniref:reversion-inducing cysteine-rich protein with Kazal motifs-like isoform X2 n=1 Tax=Stichopus japonicus TaxID=307972 RepID=UPI003AB258D6